MRKAVILLIIFTVLSRLCFWFLLYPNVTFTADSQGYLDLARLIQDFNLNGYLGYRSIGYPFLIFLAGSKLYIVVLYQCLLGILTTLVWFKILCLLKFTTKQSIAISLFFSTLLNVLVFETSILVETLTLFLLSFIIYLIIKKGLNHQSLRYNLQLSVLFGLLTLVKPFYAFLPFLYFGIYILNTFKLNKYLFYKSTIIIGSLISYFGWSYANQLNTGHFVSTTFFGLNTAQNCVRFAEKVPEEYDWIAKPYAAAREEMKTNNEDISMAIWKAYESGAIKTNDLSFPDFSKQLGDYARVAIKENPNDYLHQVVFYSFRDFWRTSIYWEDSKFSSALAKTISTSLWFVQQHILKLFRILFLLCSVLLCLQFFKLKKITIPLALTLTVMAAAILQALVTYGTNARFSFPFEFIMVIVVLHTLKALKNRYLTKRAML
tara:strand:+ start:615 stop:1916 length:1302 start_codon:yes stop_codon:yes gene_type:complete